MSSQPLIIAHRGASRHAPENTLAAFRMAIAAGSEGVEFDVRLSSDGVPVVIHDATLLRTGLQTGKVAEHTAAQLASIDVGSWFNKKHAEFADNEFANQKVPTLEQVLDELSSFCGLIYVELKTEHEDPEELVTSVCEQLRGSPLLPQMIVKSFKLGAIPKVKCQLPEVKTAALFAPQIMDFLRRRKQIVDIAREFGADQISIHRSLLTKGLVRRASEAQMPVTVWTADKPSWLKRCQKLGVDALITNDPKLMLATRNGIAMRSP